jgi:hypothetical protein
MLTLSAAPVVLAHGLFLHLALDATFAVVPPHQRTVDKGRSQYGDRDNVNDQPEPTSAFHIA